MHRTICRASGEVAKDVLLLGTIQFTGTLLLPLQLLLSSQEEHEHLLNRVCSCVAHDHDLVPCIGQQAINLGGFCS